MNKTKGKPFGHSVSAKLNKKGAEMALGMVITIIILLLVVVVIVVMITKSSDSWNTGTACVSKGGKCTTKDCGTNGEVEGASPDICGDNTALKCCKIIAGS